MTDTVNFSLKIKDEQLLTQSRLVGYLDVCAVTWLNQIHAGTSVL